MSGSESNSPGPATRAFSRGSNGERQVPLGLVVSLLAGLGVGGAGGTYSSSGQTATALQDLTRRVDQVLLRLDSIDRRQEAGDARAMEHAKELRDLVQRVTRIEERAAAREGSGPR